jgi:hypothetical protein
MPIATGHQTNLLVGESVVKKIAAADVFIACDEFQYVRHSWVNRNRLADGTWLVAPVNEHDTFAPINRVRLADQPARWREKLARTLENRLGDVGAPYAEQVRRPWRLLVGLNTALLTRLLSDLEIGAQWVFQSHLESGRHWGPAIGDDPWDTTPVSERLAAMTEEVGCDVWLSGPSGANYLDEQPFIERGIEVRYFDWQGESNYSAIELVRERLKAVA